MSFNPALETALSYAALAGDIDSVKALGDMVFDGEEGYEELLADLRAQTRERLVRERRSHEREGHQPVASDHHAK